MNRVLFSDMISKNKIQKLVGWEWVQISSAIIRLVGAVRLFPLNGSMAQRECYTTILAELENLAEKSLHFDNAQRVGTPVPHTPPLLSADGYPSVASYGPLDGLPHYLAPNKARVL